MPALRSTRALIGLSIGLLAIGGPGAISAIGQSEITPPLTPAITEIDAVWKTSDTIRLRAEAVPRGAEVVKVVFRYRGERFTAKHRKPWTYVKRVNARGRDSRGDEVHFRVRACTATRCVSRSTRDDVG